MTCPRMLLGFLALAALPLGMQQTLACPFCDALAQINGAAAGDAPSDSDEKQQATEQTTIGRSVKAKQAKPEKLASDLTALFGKDAKGSIAVEGDVLIIRGSKDFVEIAEQMIKKLDTAQAPPRAVRVYRLTDAVAQTSAEIVGRLFPESEVTVVAEESSNSLIVSCLEKREDEVSKLIQALDLAEKHEKETRKEKESMAANRIRELQVQLAELETHYSSRHPKVVSLRRKLQLLQVFEDEAAAVEKRDSPELTVRRLQHVAAAELAVTLEKLFRGETVRIAADSQANAILIRGSQKMCAQILDLVESLDQHSSEAVEGAKPFSDANARVWGLDWERVKGLDIEGLRQVYQALEEDAAKAASDYRELPHDKPAPSVKKRVETSVQRAFAARQRLQAMEVEQYRERLSQVEARIRRREVLRDRIIGRRIEDLLNPQLQWNNRSPGNPGRSDQAARSSTDHGAAGSVSAMEQTLVPRSLSQVGGGVERSRNTDRGPYFVTQVALQGPKGATATWRGRDIVDGSETEHSQVLPGTKAVSTGDALYFALTKIPDYEGLELSASIAVEPIARSTQSYLEHNSIPVQITREDIDQASSGKLVTKVVYLPNATHAELALAGIESLVTTRLDPGVNPISEAERRGHIIAILRLGNREADNGASGDASATKQTRRDVSESKFTKNDTSEIQGLWRLEKIVAPHGAHVSFEGGREAIIANDTWTSVTDGKLSTDSRLVVADPTSDPKTITFIRRSRRDGSPLTTRGIYLVKDDTLEIFTSANGSQQHVKSYDEERTIRQIWKRVAPAGKRSSDTGPAGFRQLIAGRWVLVSAGKDGETFELESTAAENPFAAQEDNGKTSSSFKSFRKFTSAVFGDDHVSFGPHWNQTGEQRKYALENETDPRRITLSEGDKTTKGIIWAWKRQMVVSLAEEGGDFPKDFDSKGNGTLVLRYERDETDPQWLRSEVARLRELATNLLLHGNEVQQKTAREFKDLADSMEREANRWEQACSAKSQADESRKIGKLQQAKSLENEAAELRAGAEQERAMRMADQRIREQEERFREKIKQLNFRAGALRNEGRFDEADEIDREVQQLLRDRDPDLKRANELKQRAASARLEGKHRDAELYDQQADDLLRAIRQRYKGIDLPGAAESKRSETEELERTSR